MATTAALTENSRQGINFQIPHCIGLDARLSPNLCWECGHAYDETPVGLVVYVRNDPVNKIDPDGRDWLGPDGIWYPNIDGGTVTVTAPPPPPVDTFMMGILWDLLFGFSGTTPDEWSDLSGGGPPSVPQFHVRNPSKTGSNQNRIVTVMNWIKTNIDSDCAKWLGDVQGTITSLLGNSNDSSTVYIAHGVFDDARTGAITNATGTDLPDGFAAIVVNDNGAFFRGYYMGASMTAGNYAGGSSQAQVMILLHELSHFLDAPGIQHDFNNPSAVNANDNLVKKNCAKTLAAARRIR